MNLYNKESLVEALLNEHEKGFSEFFSLIEISKAKYGREFTDAVWKHLNTNVEFMTISETVSAIESAMNPLITQKLNEKNGKV
jgi:hypothetical protein